jgi:predicted nucleotidyltransferase
MILYMFDASIHKAALELRRHGASAVYIFGSQAAGAPRDDSDVDIAVKGLPPRRFFRAMADAQAVLNKTLDLVDLDEPSPFVDYLLRSGELQHVA